VENTYNEKTIFGKILLYKWQKGREKENTFAKRYGQMGIKR